MATQEQLAFDYREAWRKNAHPDVTNDLYSQYKEAGGRLTPEQLVASGQSDAAAQTPAQSQAPVTAPQAPANAQQTASQPVPVQQTGPSAEATQAAIAAQSGGGNAGASGNNRLQRQDPSTLKSYVEKQFAAAQQEAETRIDRSVQQGVNALAEAQTTANKQFDEQQAQISRDEALATDNQALYEAAKGSNGGIGRSQVSSIANTAARNRQNVNAARIQFGIDVKKQMDELYHNGEIDKVLALLQTTQAKLSQLVSIEDAYNQRNLEIDRYNLELALREEEFNYQKFVDDRNYQYTLSRDAVADARYNQEYADSRADTAWSQRMAERQYNDSRADTAWNQGFAERQYADSRSDTAWNQGMAERQQGLAEQQYKDSRADTAWNQGMALRQQNLTERQYNDSRADTLWSRNMALRQQANSEQQSDANQAMALLQIGVIPPQNLLDSIGMSRDEASAVASTYAAATQAKTASTTAKAATDSSGRTRLDQSDLYKILYSDTGGDITEGVRQDYQYYYGQNYFVDRPEELSDLANDYADLIGKNGGLTESQWKRVQTDLQKGRIWQSEYDYLTWWAQQQEQKSSSRRGGFEASMQRVAAFLNAGNTTSAVRALDSVWSSLTEEQQERMQKTLGAYGVRYSPD